MYRDIKIFPIVFLMLIACSATQNNPDPHKNFNEDALEFNLIVDKNILKPVSSTYKDVVPDGMRRCVSNFLWNLREPFFFINYCATANAENAANSLFRFVINSTIGVFGFFDVGGHVGLQKSEISHKTTLKKWGVSTGDYLVLPILGASSTRDAIAEPISWYLDPVTYFIGFPYMFAKSILSIIDDRAENSNIVNANLNNSIGLYFTLRSLYLQKYAADTSNANVESSTDDSAEDEEF
jgi:phospholipid-binding lipoprotein MlaA